MKLIISFLIVCFLFSCNNPQLKQISDLSAKSGFDSPSDTLGMASQIHEFEEYYNSLEKQFYDSISKIQNDNIDFSNITNILEKRYQECTNEFKKNLFGYKLALNYYIQYESSYNEEYSKKAKPLFYSFISFKNGEVASRYLKLDIKNVNYIIYNWDDFSEQEKQTIIFYGLLRGFGNGLPEFLKDID